jgi:hypothetical protein
MVLRINTRNLLLEILGQKKSAVVTLDKNFPCILLITDNKKGN